MKVDNLSIWRNGVQADGRTPTLLRKVDSTLEQPQFRNDWHVLVHLEQLLELELAVLSSEAPRLDMTGKFAEARTSLLDALDKVRAAIDGPTVAAEGDG